MATSNHPNTETLTLFLYGELESAMQDDIQKHLKDCNECRQKFDRWNILKTKLDVALNPEPVEPITKKTTNKKGIEFAVLINLAAVVLIALGSFYWGAQFDSTHQSELVEELKDELASIKTTLARSQQGSTNPDIYQEIEAIKLQLAEKNQLAKAANDLSRDDFRKLLSQVVAISNQTTRLREEISSLAVNANAEIEKNRKAVAQLFVNSELTNQTFEIPNP